MNENENDHYDLNRTLAAIAADASGSGSSHEVIAKLSEHVASAVDGADGCAVSLNLGDGHIVTVGATDPDLDAADRFQNELGEGPCLESFRETEVVHVQDLRVDQRWPRWAKPVSEQLGFRSILSAHMTTRQRRVGALNVYARRVGAFTERDVAQIPFFAAHAAAAIAAARQVEQLREALVSRTRIGQAEGIVMERHGIQEEEAFALLTRLSQHRNEKLRDVAETIVARRLIPEDPLDS